ncbi:MAG: malonyl-CoA decarboxylase [Lautropia sp.]
MFERFLQSRRSERERGELGLLLKDCRQLLTERGESNSVAIASRALARYRGLPAELRLQFFDLLASEFDPDPGEVLRLAERYAVTRSPENLIKLSRAAEPPRQELLRRLNRAPGGTEAIVRMREKLLERLRAQRKLQAVDADFEHLLSSWFNPGFLTLVRVDWNSPAALLERLIQHEAVHEIDGWNDLRRRLQPDRRCFAFMHPVLAGEPLIFVEVALLAEMPAAIAPLLDRSIPEPPPPGKAKVAAFYSISNCQPGLRGINLGNFLIKRVAELMRAEVPTLKTFCTLSPIPGFAGWLARTEAIDAEDVAPDRRKRLNGLLQGLRQRHRSDLGGLAGLAPDTLQPADDAALRALCAHYLLHATHSPDGRGDPVARFHLNNGARLERVNSLADLSKKGLRQSHALMVNYLYDLDEIENNHEAFVNGSVVAARAVTSL